ncbi:MAG: DUF3127 domain-containing protein [Bacteroidaceae bacterium]|nr:DUF3127 domain-containing protein [Bacteroidaceae bacterium]
MPTIQGKIIRTFEPRSGQNDRGSWMAQDFLLESYDQPYPRRCLFSVWGADRLQQFNIKEGDDLAVDIDLDAREYNGRYYNSVRAWRVVRITPPQPQVDSVADAPIGVGQPLPPPSSMGGAATVSPDSVPPSADPLMAGDVTEDLPF